MKMLVRIWKTVKNIRLTNQPNFQSTF